MEREPGVGLALVFGLGAIASAVICGERRLPVDDEPRCHVYAPVISAYMLACPVVST